MAARVCAVRCIQRVMMTGKTRRRQQRHILSNETSWRAVAAKKSGVWLAKNKQRNSAIWQQRRATACGAAYSEAAGNNGMAAATAYGGSGSDIENENSMGRSKLALASTALNNGSVSGIKRIAYARSSSISAV